MGELYNRLKEYSQSDYYPFHMPGHKRQNITDLNPYSYDITEIDGFDNLHNPEGILRIAMDRASKMYGTERTYFMINGSSGGILTAISACAKKGDKILVARNCHKSVYNAIYLNELEPVYIYPEYIEEFGINGGITPECVRAALEENADIRAVVITSPTYEGIVSDVKSIAGIVHSHNIPLIVDEAHGAHFSMHDELPETAVLCDADVVIQSMHKTLPALTQTALLHLNGNIVNRDRIEKYLGIFQTSSPSYVLMASMDECFDILLNDGEKMFEGYMSRMKTLNEYLKEFTHLKFTDSSLKGKYGVFDVDISKIVASCRGTGYTGAEMYRELLDRHHLQLEMASGDYVIAMTSVMDTQEGLLRLFKALADIDRHIRVYGNKNNNLNYGEYDYRMEKAVVVKKISDISDCRTETMRLDMAQGKISAEYIYLYPPGIPVVAPGEMVTGEIVVLLRRYMDSGLTIQGLKDKKCENIEVVKEEFKTLVFRKE